MRAGIDDVNAALSRVYGRPVEAGYNNGGWPCIWSDDMGTLIAGGLPGQAPEIPVAILDLMSQRAALVRAVAEFDAETVELQERKTAAEEADLLCQEG